MQNISDQTFVKLAIWLTLFSIVALVSLNYLVDPYNLYGHNLIDVKKTQEIGQLRLSKANNITKIKPASIILGSSRAEFGFDPDHRYFTKPSYNAATGGSSVYELRYYLEHALQHGELEQILLVADYINFNSNEEKKVRDFEELFNASNIYSYLFSLSTLKNTYLTWVGERQKKYTLYRTNGQREKEHNSRNLQQFGGQLKKIHSQVTYFNGFDNNNHYRDTGRSSFLDFEYILELSYKNELSLEVIFGPNHIIHWEALDHSIGLDKWYRWKKDVVALNEKIAKNFNTEPYRIIDYATYFEYTMEKLPDNSNDEMKFHWELNHYKSEFGDIVLDDLVAMDPTFGVNLSMDTIDTHLDQQKVLRELYVDSASYKDRVLVQRKKDNLNNYFKYVDF